MPYKLRITNEEVENELKKMGFQDFSEELVESFRKDLLKLIKSDLKKLKKQKENENSSDVSKDFHPNHFKADYKAPSTSTPSSLLEMESDREKVRYSEEYEHDTRSSASSSSGATSKQASSISTETSRMKIPEEKDHHAMEERSLVSTKQKDIKSLKMKKQEELPSYPEKADPVNLYHYYKAYWDKYKAPGEDPRNALRWEIRSKLFYASKDL